MKVWWVFRHFLLVNYKSDKKIIAFIHTKTEPLGYTVGLQDHNLFIHTLFFYKSLSRVTDINSFDYILWTKTSFQARLCLEGNIRVSPTLTGHIESSIGISSVFLSKFVFKIFLGQAFISFLTSRQNPSFNNTLNFGSTRFVFFLSLVYRGSTNLFQNFVFQVQSQHYLDMQYWHDVS